MAKAKPRGRDEAPEKTPAEAFVESGGLADGRRLRADANRRKIVEAMIELVREGDHMPAAEAVAERAEVARRTVFRLFTDMDTLYREIFSVMLERLGPILTEPFTAPDWRGRLEQLLDRRARLFEEMMPVKAAADANRNRSPFLQAQHARLVAMQREMIEYVPPARVVADADLMEALDLTMSFEAWRRLRQDQRLNRRQARAAVSRVVGALLDKA